MGEGGFLILLLAVLAGLLALVFSVLAMIGKTIAAVVSAVLGMLGIGGGRRAARRRECGNPRCRRVEVRPARFCSRCGRALV